MLIQGQVGPSSAQSVQPGSTPAVRLGQQGDLIASELHGRYYEATYRNTVFMTWVNAVTLTSNHATPIAAGSGTPIISLYNPAGSGKNISLIRVQQSHTSGTPAGPLIWNIIPNPQNITAIPNVQANNMSTLAPSGSVAKIWNNIAITGSTVGTTFRNAGGMDTTATGAGIASYVEEYAGTFFVPPGSMIALACTGAGSTNIINAWLEWEEVPI
jgi:hypothetical protein